MRHRTRCHNVRKPGWKNPEASAADGDPAGWPANASDRLPNERFQPRYVVEKASRLLENAAGNFYINDKPTGAVVGQQPFGGARASGTNDKAGSYLNLLRWVSPRTIKETFVPPTDYRYPFLLPD